MDESTRLWMGAGFLLAGTLLIRLRMLLVPWLTGLYQKLGIDVPQEQYARQFFFIGVLVILFGILIATNLITIF
jgi:hypothetical protein